MALLTLGSNIKYLKGIGEKRAETLGRLGVSTVEDILRYYPRSYLDRTAVRNIGSLLPDENVCVSGQVITAPQTVRISGGRTRTKLRIADDTGVMDIIFFNQKYAAGNLKLYESYVFYGKVTGDLIRREMINPQYAPGAKAGEFLGIVPVYPLSAGVSQKLVSGAVKQALSACADLVEETLPEEVRKKFDLPQVGLALRQIHFPENFDAAQNARRRMAFEELFVLTMGLVLIKNRRDKKGGRRLRAVEMAPFMKALPYELTGAQHRCLADAIGDMTSGRLMNRLIQGDVGSGKTAVAAACAYFIGKNGGQCAYMAPTEILAEQHYVNLSPLLEKLGIKCALLTGGMKAAARREAERLAESGEAALIIGTHALISQKVSFNDLALVITDEQHRFGVGQRAALAEKGQDPHILVMSATPIPRTLALIMYGDLDVSILDELPPGRQAVKTYAVDESFRDRINRFIDKVINKGRQVFIVCPAVEEAEIEGLKSAQEHAAELQQNIFPHLRVGLVHGRMKSAEKEAAMGAFAAGELDILVATTVIEVGVDVPNATLMVVENADRFGLSQLHQLRGRVGRGEHESYCVLFKGAGDENAMARLKALERTNDGFAIAEEDLKQRGPGDFFGSRQHGLPQLTAADLTMDVRLLSQAQEAAEDFIKGGENQPGYAALKRRVDALFSTNSSFN
ncbi:MAG: ATP-dependent DNA helicase RecG [Oscillospiraceae bacterium]|nr:ATP-dependent DNA helicase RecG [Oscillospiraceae bacterium]